MSTSRNRGSSGLPRGSRTFTYVLIAVISLLVAYFIVLPAFTPKAPTSTTGPSNPNAPAVSLSPGTDIPVYSSVTISGQNLSPKSNVTATFNGAPLTLTNTTSGTSGCRTTASRSLAGCLFWVPQESAGSYDVVVTAGNTTAMATFKVPQYTPPVSTVLVTLTSVSLGLVTQLVTRKVVDLNAERRMRAEVSAFQKEKREATLAKDKAKLEKLKKRELAVQQEQFKVQRARLKVTGITFVPLLAVYYLMASFLGGYGVVVAVTSIPIPIIAAATLTPGTYIVSLFWWYFLSSFTFSTMLSRLLHTTP
jgi:uncharacterized membrane protein (DUF106 family)